ncbi:class A beta-lactamase [Streptomyces sp. NPDC097619]|uniref:class A beta-lactamase n=1 Tax=Streptomyces sp. NPDC097619 TaxID=3157228 RepID=UPI003332F2AB
MTETTRPEPTPATPPPATPPPVPASGGSAASGAPGPDAPRARPSRRTALALGAGALVATGAGYGLGAADSAAAESRPGADSRPGPRLRERPVVRRLRELEESRRARLGAYAVDTVSGRAVLYRADELFPMCSVFKPLAAAAVLRAPDRDGTDPARRIRYTRADTEGSGYAPVTGLPENLARGMTVEALCAAAVSHSDNAAANLLLRELGGPDAVTRFCRSIGDRVTRLDRWEPELNSAEPGRTTDTTSPRAIGRTYARLLLGDTLARRDRTRLTRWMLDNTTNTERFRAGLPGWTLADKTGGGSAYGVANDAGVVWSPEGTPVVMVVLTTHPGRPEGPGDNGLVAEAARLLGAALT